MHLNLTRVYLVVDDESIPGKFRINSILPENTQQVSCRACDTAHA